MSKYNDGTHRSPTEHHPLLAFGFLVGHGAGSIYHQKIGVGDTGKREKREEKKGVNE